jgi:O-antigen/teichoic acid export membrane protein
MPQMPHMAEDDSGGSATIGAVTATEPRRLRTDVGLMLGAKGAAMVLNVVATVIVARALGVSGRGAFAVAFSLTLLLVQFGTVGMVTANPYFVARDPSARGRIVANAVWMAVVLGTLGIAGGVLLRLIAPTLTQGLSWAELLVAIAGVPAALAASFLQSVLLGEGRTITMNVIEVAMGIVTTVAMAIALLLLGAGVLCALAISTAGFIAAALAFGVAAARGVRVAWRPDVALARTMLGYGFRIYVATLVGFLVLRLDLLLVNGYLGERQAGLYSVVAALAQGMYVIPAVVGVNLFPRIARGGPDEISAGVFRSFSLIYAALCLITIPLAPVLIRVLFGRDFDGAVELYWWLVPGVFALGMLTVLSHHFAGRGFPLEAMLVWFVGLGVNLGLNLLFLDRYGTWIASLSSSIAYAVLLALHVRMFARDVGGYGVLRPSARETVRFLRVALSR